MIPAIPGQTRTRVRSRHALITPDGHIASVVPGVTDARVVAHITPAMGAYFIYVQDGSVETRFGGSDRLLTAGSYLFLPSQTEAHLRTAAGAPRLVIFQKTYVPAPNLAPPRPVLGTASKIEGQPFLGNPRALLQVLLPDEPAFDLAVNIFT